MARRLALLLALAVALAGALAVGGRAAQDPGREKQIVDAKLAQVQAKIAGQRRRESALSGQIGGLTTQIHTLERRVGGVSSRLAALRADVALHERRLAKLNELYGLQTVRLTDLKREYRLAVRRLDLRLLDIYKEDDPTTVDLVLAAKSFDDVLDQVNYFNAIAAQDKHVAAEVASSKRQVKIARTETSVARQGVQQETRVINARAQQQAILIAELNSSKSRLAGARAGKSKELAATKQAEQDSINESQALAAASATLAARLRAAANSAAESGGSSGTGTSTAPAPNGSISLIWPVSGPITSPFGMRWGSLHPGIDIGVPSDTPIHAAAAGTVVWCGWMSGYGNLVMIDHGGGFATLYGHQTRVAVSCNQQVAQGDLIGYSGCTGFCTGPHVHFELRVNGTPTDPLAYLP